MSQKESIIKPNTTSWMIDAQKTCFIGCTSVNFSIQLSLGDKLTTCNTFSGFVNHGTCIINLDP